MIGLFPTGKTKKQIPLKKFLLAFFVCASIATWIGISTIFADEDDPADNTEASFQNPAQAQHANNVAILAALQDPDVIKAKEDQDADLANIIDAKIAEITEDISAKRAEDMGWGDIAKFYNVHPKYLGLGHSRYVSTQLRKQSEIKAATARSYKGNSMKGHGMTDSTLNSKKFGFPQKTLVVGQAYNGHNKNRGLALGHSKDNGGGHGNGNGGGKNK
jgi:hypothetical protein